MEDMSLPVDDPILQIQRALRSLNRDNQSMAVQAIVKEFELEDPELDKRVLQQRIEMQDRQGRYERETRQYRLTAVVVYGLLLVS